MYAIAFDMDIATLKKTYGEPYNNAYAEISKVMKKVGFYWTQGSVYLSENEKDGLGLVYDAMSTLREIDWFKASVRDIRAFKVEDWSNFLLKDLRNKLLCKRLTRQFCIWRVVFFCYKVLQYPF